MLTKTDIEKYFLAEKQIGLLFFIIGIVAVLLAIVFFFVLRSGFYKGAAIPLVILGLLQLFAGFAVYKKSDSDRIRNVYAFDMNPQELKAVELPRIRQVNKSFAVYKIIEIILILVGIALFFYLRTRPEKAFWLGLSITLSIQALVTFTADYTASARAKEYMQKLEAFVEKTK